MAKQRNQRLRDPNARLQRIGQMPIDAQIREIRDVLVDMWSIISPFTITVTADYTASGKVAVEEVECNNTSGITVNLHALPEDRDIVIVSRANTGAVTVATAGSETINGNASIVILNQYDTPNFIWRADLNDWRIF